eukprot:scaffold45089_cov52-Phaeocystis_antarctica.AAC.1
MATHRHVSLGTICRAKGSADEATLGVGRLSGPAGQPCAATADWPSELWGWGRLGCCERRAFAFETRCTTCRSQRSRSARTLQTPSRMKTLVRVVPSKSAAHSALSAPLPSFAFMKAAGASSIRPSSPTASIMGPVMRPAVGMSFETVLMSPMSSNCEALDSLARHCNLAATTCLGG